MATPMDLIDADVMTYGGIADAATARGEADERADWCGASAAYLARAIEMQRRAEVELRGLPAAVRIARTPGVRRSSAPVAALLR